MAYTSINKPSNYFNTVTYTGNGTAIGSGGQSITGVGFQPDFLWIKNRSSVLHHGVFDVVRGTPKRLLTSSTAVEDSNAETVDSFDTDGFTVGSNSNVNGSGNSLVAWNWLAGGTAVSNTQGSITSSVSANTTAGFSIVSYTGSSSLSTVGHGLGVAPSMIIIKNRSSAYEWPVYHKDLAANYNLYLNTTAAAAQSDVGDLWNSTAPTSSVFTLNGNLIYSNYSGQNYIAYCFAEKKGFSKFGSYTGNGSTNGTFVYCGFKPAWVMTKRTDAINAWLMHDIKRSPLNPMDNQLFANTSGAEDTTSTNDNFDFVANGFKCRNTGGAYNASGGTYIYMAFAESPFVTSTGVPTTAR